MRNGRAWNELRPQMPPDGDPGCEDPNRRAYSEKLGRQDAAVDGNDGELRPRERFEQARPERGARDGEQRYGDKRADQSVQESFADKGQPDVGVRRTDELRDGDLAPSREDRQANRVGDDDAGDGEEDDDDRDADAPQQRAELQKALHDLLSVNDVIDAGQT